MAARAAHEQARHLQGNLRWEDLAWMRDRWKGRLYVKGIMSADDAAHAVDVIGADGVVVSNHGGRQLDSVQGTLDALPAIAERIGDRAEVYMDGGVRRGTDVIIALCLGARGVFIGRPYLFGLAVAGQAGVESVLAILREEIQRDLILLGCNSVGSLNKRWLASPHARDV
jgi:L-lactate dehydrogenase (cytochrome)/(S)-mandelate dehydrogenase